MINLLPFTAENRASWLHKVVHRRKQYTNEGWETVLDENGSALVNSTLSDDIRTLLFIGVNDQNELPLQWDDE
jgi:hypothetical protein